MKESSGGRDDVAIEARERERRVTVVLGFLSLGGGAVFHSEPSSGERAERTLRASLFRGTHGGLAALGAYCIVRLT